MKLRGADVLARTLAAAGARRVFTLSGNHVMPVFDAALDAKLDLVHVRHEAAAVHMADAWGRLTGEPGVALVTGGPGHANALGALYTALMSDSPMLLLSGHAPLAELGKGAFQELPQAELAAPLTKLSFTAQSAETIGRDLVRALEAARGGRPGPVHLSLPTDVLDARVEADIPAASPREETPAVPAEILEALRQAKKPLVVTARLGAADFEAVSGVPEVSMQSPRGLNDATLGRVASLLAQADVVLLAGKRLDYTLKYGRAFDPAARILRLETPRGLAEAARGLGWQKSGWLREVKDALAYRPAAWQKLALSAGAAHPAAVCRALQPMLESPQAILVCDGGEYGQWAQACLRAPRRLTNGQAGAIGSALPFAAAAKLAFPDAPVLAMLGDGTFGFHMSELDTAVRHKLGYIAVVGTDACWNAEYQIQLREYGKDRAHGLDLLPTRYGAAAAALGAHGEDVMKGVDLPDALARARNAGRVACVNVAIERAAAPAY